MRELIANAFGVMARDREREKCAEPARNRATKNHGCDRRRQRATCCDDGGGTGKAADLEGDADSHRRARHARIPRGEGRSMRPRVVHSVGRRPVEVADAFLDLRIGRENGNAAAVEAGDLQLIDGELERIGGGEDADGLSGAIFACSVACIHTAHRASGSGFFEFGRFPGLGSVRYLTMRS